MMTRIRFHSIDQLYLDQLLVSARAALALRIDISDTTHSRSRKP